MSVRALGGAWLIVLLLLGGCTQPKRLGTWTGPALAAPFTTEPWQFGPSAGVCVKSEHYRIFTTVEDEETRDLLTQVMEGAYARYREVAPTKPGATASAPLDCYIFRARGEWDAFTRARTGRDAQVYLQIRSGGYTFGDVAALYHIGRSNMYSVAVHEGWHQYCARNFRGRLPPAFEEGLACLFESVNWRDRLPRFNLSVNAHRAHGLRRAFEDKLLLPLDSLIAMHAGDIVGQRSERIDAFYGQAWALARFLREGEDGAYRPLFEAWLADVAAGTVRDESGMHNQAGALWSRKAVRPVVERYFGVELPVLQEQYERFMRRIAFDELGSH